MFKIAVAGVVGFALGLYVAKLYAKHQVQSGVDDFLGSIGLGGGTIQKAADSFIPNAVVD